MRIVLLLATLALTACATRAVDSATAVPVPADRVLAFASAGSDTAPVTVTRDSGMMNAGCPLAFLVDGKPALMIRRAETATLHLPAGDRLVGVAPAGGGLCDSQADRYRREVSQRVVAGQPLRLRIGLQSDGEPYVQPTSG